MLLGLQYVLPKSLRGTWELRFLPRSSISSFRGIPFSVGKREATLRTELWVQKLHCEPKRGLPIAGICQSKWWKQCPGAGHTAVNLGPDAALIIWMKAAGVWRCSYFTWYVVLLLLHRDVPWTEKKNNDKKWWDRLIMELRIMSVVLWIWWPSVACWTLGILS